MSGLGGWFGDTRLALRSIRHSPLFAGVVIATLALAIGGVTAVFTLVDPMLFRPLPYGAPDQIVRARVDGGTLGFLQYADYFRAKTLDVFDRAGTFYGPAEIGRLGEDDDTIIGYAVTDGFLDVLRVNPSLGRLFTTDEYRSAIPRGPGIGAGAQVAVITDGLWKRGFGSRPDIVGQSLRITSTGVTHTMQVVGVLGPDFVFPDYTNEAPAFVVPGSLDEGRAGDPRAYADLFARLRPGQTIEQATAGLQQAVTDSEREFAKLPQHRQAGLRPLREALFGSVRTPLLMLLGITLCVLVLASVNLAHLYLARASGRLREIAVRQALGASAWHVVRLLLAEAIILAVLGGASAIALGKMLYAVVMAVMPRFGHVYRLMHATVDLRVVIAAVLTTVGALLVFGLVPALKVVRTDIRSALQATAGRARGGRRRSDAVLTIVQTSLAVSVLVTAALLVGSFITRIGSINGVDLDGLSSVGVELPRDYFTDLARAHALYRDLATRLSSESGRSGGIARGIPGLTLPGRLWRANDAADTSSVVVAYPSDRTFLDVIKAELLRGRLYTNEEAWANAPVAVVDQRTADLLWPGQEALGQVVRDQQTASQDLRTVVGVVRTVNVNLNPDRAQTGAAFVPLDPIGRSGDFMVLRGTLTAQLTDAVKQIVKQLEPRAIARVAPLVVFERALGQPKLLARLFGALGGLALLLTIAGIYGVVSHAVAGRTGEIGIRMALGSSAARVRRMILRESLQPALVGVIGGLGLSLWWTRTLRSLLFELQPNDPLIFSLTALVVLAVVALAGSVPARRASRVDPVVALRAE